MTLDYDGFAIGVRGLGPGTRVALWVRGCGIGCKGCMTKELWHSGTRRPIEPLVEEMLPHLERCDGLTISGGEPFDQAHPLSSMIDTIRQHIDVHVFSYSGYKIEKLRKLPDARGLLSRIDMLMDGPYVDSLPTNKPWRGSENQRLHLLSERAKSYVGEPQDWRELQLQPLTDGSVRLIGIPKRGDVERMRAALHAKGLMLRSEP